MTTHLDYVTGRFVLSEHLVPAGNQQFYHIYDGDFILGETLVPGLGGGGGLFLDASLDLNFAENLSLVDDVSGNNLITFSRASTGTYVGSDGLIKTAVADAPRFDHDPVTGESLGLLIEESRTNYCIDSENPAGWTVTNGASKQTFTAVTAPDGSTLTQGFRLPDGASRVYPTLSSPGTIVPVSSFYVRSVSGTATLNLFIQGVNVGSNISVPPDRWLRISGTSASNTVTGFSVRGNSSQSEDVYIWGAQLEAGSFATSYIPTSGTTVTRAADVASITGTNFSSWYNQSEGTVFTQYRVANLATSYYLNFDDGTASNDIVFVENSNSVRIAENSTINYQQNIGIPAVGDTRKIVLGLAANNTRAATEGVLYSLDTSVTLPTVTQFRNEGNTVGHIARLAYFSTRKSDQDLITITDGTLAPAIITYGITSTGGTFNLLSTGTVDYAVDWDSTGGYETSTLNTLPHTYTAGDYDLVVYSDGVYRPYFNNVTADSNQITSVAIGSGADLGTNLTNAWFGASNMTTFTCPFDVTSSVASFVNAWRNCSSLNSFPLLSTSSVTSFSYAWYGCNSLTTFPANMFDTTGTLVGNAFDNAWFNCALTAQSIENILVSLDTNGATGITLSINGGTNAAKTTWSTAAVTAYDNLIVKGWTISFNA